jgi:DUF1365 family protein
MTGSALYVGRVRHRRYGSPRHEFAYPMWHALIDLDELPDLTRRVRLLSHNRFNLAGFDDRDHLGPERVPVRDKLDAWLRGRGVDEPVSRVGLLTQLRLFGHVFNPVSFFFCHDAGDRLRHVVAEVNNTFGESTCYLLDGSGRVVRDEADKTLHVSPFQPMSGRYRFRITPPGDRLAVHVDVLRDGERVFDSTLTGERRELTTGSLLQTVLRHPHSGLRTLALIHYQALRLWLKKAPFHAKPELPAQAWRTRHG